MGRYQHVKSAKEIIENHLHEYLVGKEDVGFIRQSDWRKIAGEKIATHSKPLYVERGILIIEIEDAAWNYFLLLRSEEIIRTANKVCKNLCVKSLKIELTREQKS